MTETAEEKENVAAEAEEYAEEFESVPELSGEPLDTTVGFQSPKRRSRDAAQGVADAADLLLRLAHDNPVEALEIIAETIRHRHRERYPTSVKLANALCERLAVNMSVEKRVARFSTLKSSYQPTAYKPKVDAEKRVASAQMMRGPRSFDAEDGPGYSNQIKTADMEPRPMVWAKQGDRPHRVSHQGIFTTNSLQSSSSSTNARPVGMKSLSARPATHHGARGSQSQLLGPVERSGSVGAGVGTSLTGNVGARAASAGGAARQVTRPGEYGAPPPGISPRSMPSKGLNIPGRVFMPAPSDLRRWEAERKHEAHKKKMHQMRAAQKDRNWLDKMRETQKPWRGKA